MATLAEQTAQLLIELAEGTSRIEEIIQEADAARWAISLDDGLVVTVELDEEREVLSLATDLGRPSNRHRAVCEALLIYTSLQQSTGGIAMALAERHGEFQQLCDVAARDFDPG